MAELPSSTHPVPDVVYHYTNTAGLLGILSAREIWLGDVEFMNDAQEISYARDTVMAELRARADALAPASIGGPETEASNRAEIIRTAASMLEEFGGRYHVYAACFCESGDLLSQWRGYAGEGGYALGFRTSSLTGLTVDGTMGHQVRLVKIAYGLDEARSQLSNLVSKVAPFANDHIGVMAWHEMMFNALPVAATIKHRSFREEQEWRVTAVGALEMRGVSFRTGSIGLIPYRKVGLPADAITRIVIGPGRYPAVRESSVSQFLESLELPEIEVVTSASPLRN